MMVLFQIIVFIAALAALVLGSEYFVKAAAAIAEKTGVSEFIVGLTLVAVGTSLPELASSTAASLRAESGIIIGNIVGSNIANIALIIGLSAAILAINTDESMLIRDGYIMLFVTLLFYGFIIYGHISRIAAFILVILYIAYIVFLFETRTKGRDEYHFKAFIPYLLRFGYIMAIHRRVKAHLSRPKEKKGSDLRELLKKEIHKDLLIMLVSGITIILGAKYVISEAVYLAGHFNIATNVIGLSLIAFGTSVPELSVSLTAARKGYSSIAVGNILGSNIANLLLVGGVSGLIHPLDIPYVTLIFTGPVMIVTAIFLLIFIKSDWKIHRTEGLSFLVIYVLFLIILFTRMNF